MKMDLWLCFGELGEGIILAAVFNYFLILPFENFPQLYWLWVASEKFQVLFLCWQPFNRFYLLFDAQGLEGINLTEVSLKLEQKKSYLSKIWVACFRRIFILKNDDSSIMISQSQKLSSFIKLDNRDEVLVLGIVSCIFGAKNLNKSEGLGTDNFFLFHKKL